MLCADRVAQATCVQMNRPAGQWKKKTTKHNTSLNKVETKKSEKNQNLVG